MAIGGLAAIFSSRAAYEAAKKHRKAMEEQMFPKGGFLPNEKTEGLVGPGIPAPTPCHYSQERWEQLLATTQKTINELAKLKGGEYAGDEDRLANFRRNGLALGLPMETIWAVYAGKHWDAIQQFIKDSRNGTSRERLEPIGGRVDDLLVYLLLLKAMLDERGLL